jgi:hypothetical protein
MTSLHHDMMSELWSADDTDLCHLHLYVTKRILSAMDDAMQFLPQQMRTRRLFVLYSIMRAIDSVKDVHEAELAQTQQEDLS